MSRSAMMVTLTPPPTLRAPTCALLRPSIRACRFSVRRERPFGADAVDWRTETADEAFTEAVIEAGLTFPPLPAVKVTVPRETPDPVA